MNETTKSMYRRMVIFGVNSIRIGDSLPETVGSQILARQLCRSGTSVGANYREAQRARTKTEFTSKLQISLGEVDETLHWAEILAELGYTNPETIGAYLTEANELTSILVTSVRSAKSKR